MYGFMYGLFLLFNFCYLNDFLWKNKGVIPNQD